MPRSVPARRLVLLPLLAASLAACGGPPAPPVANVQPALIPTSVPASPSAAPTASPTASPTPEPTATSVITATPEPTATTEPTATPRPDVSLVTGNNSYARGTITQRPWMVMIDNHPDAYPQSGMDKASVVFEGLAEYGITRFIALYEDGVSPEVAEIGPVRSTRLYFAQWAMGFHPIYAHAGGSPDGVQLAETTDQFINFEALRQTGYTWRDQRRLAPHNLYTSSALLRGFAAATGVAGFDYPDAGFLFDTIAPQATPEVTGIDYFFLDRSSRAGFVYDAGSNKYWRTMWGSPHIDRVTGQQLSVNNVVVMQVNEAARVGDDKRRIDQEVIGSGPARIFMAGGRVDATWHKPSAEAPLRFYDATDQEIVFNAGTIWIAAIPTLDRLSLR